MDVAAAEKSIEIWCRARSSGQDTEGLLSEAVDRTRQGRGGGQHNHTLKLGRTLGCGLVVPNMIYSTLHNLCSSLALT